MSCPLEHPFAGSLMLRDLLNQQGHQIGRKVSVRLQFTSVEFTRTLKAHGIRISTDGKGRWRDNVFVERLWKSVKYEGSTCVPTTRSVPLAMGWRATSLSTTHANLICPLTGTRPDAVYFESMPFAQAA